MCLLAILPRVILGAPPQIQDWSEQMSSEHKPDSPVQPVETDSRHHRSLPFNDTDSYRILKVATETIKTDDQEPSSPGLEEFNKDAAIKSNPEL
jgi:hypothetical protein